MLTLPTYVLVTPAHNEAQFIELTIRSVVAQTVRPAKWVIVSDGSTDGTDEIVRRYLVEYPWIELVRLPERHDRHFAGKVAAFNAGHARLYGISYDVIGNLDADISFDREYLAFLMSRFAENPRLGVAGTPFQDGGKTYDYRFSSIEHVSGACQMFRRECFEQVGGYRPQKSGGVDLVAVLSARARGWQTRTFTEKVCVHHRPMDSARAVGIRERFYRGRMDYILGSHPAWEVFRALYQMRHPPYIGGGLLILAGYFWTMGRGVERTMPQELIAFRRREQLQRLKTALTRNLSFVPVR